MAEALLVEDSWSSEVEPEHPDGGTPHPNGWEEDDQRRAREDELTNQAGVTDEVQGGSQVTDENTEPLAVTQIQVKAQKFAFDHIKTSQRNDFLKYLP